MGGRTLWCLVKNCTGVFIFILSFVDALMIGCCSSRGGCEAFGAPHSFTPDVHQSCCCSFCTVFFPIRPRNIFLIQRNHRQETPFTPTYCKSVGMHQEHFKVGVTSFPPPVHHLLMSNPDAFDLQINSLPAFDHRL